MLRRLLTCRSCSLALAFTSELAEDLFTWTGTGYSLAFCGAFCFAGFLMKLRCSVDVVEQKEVRNKQEA